MHASGRWWWTGPRLAVALGLAVLAVIPAPWIERCPAVCLFQALFGVECLGCGMTRALSALLHGDLAAALAYNKLVLVVFPALVACLFGAGCSHARAGRV